MTRRAIILTCWGCGKEREVVMRSARKGIDPDVLVLPPHWLWIRGRAEPSAMLTERPACPDCQQILKKWLASLMIEATEEENVSD